MLQYNIVGDGEGGEFITVHVLGQAPQSAHSSHTNYEAIRDGARLGDESVLSLFDISEQVIEKFEPLTERVSVANGRVYFDGVEIHGAITGHILRSLEANLDDYYPYVNFLENVMQNPNEHSREQLGDWLDADEFTIDDEGYIRGYKGVAKNSDGQWVSIHSGRAYVNGEVRNGRIPNEIGNVITMPRDEVEFDPAVGCHTGLHVGTYGYAEGFANGGLLEVRVNPRDVVSVPTDCSAQKMRVCRYEVVDTIEAPHTVTVLRDYDEEDGEFGWGDGEYDGDEDECEDCGEYMDYCECGW
jgi:hypothetical protein